MGMKTSTIKTVLRNQLQNWIKSIKDNKVKEAVEKDCFITGGAIASLLQGEMPNDYDVYFRSKETALLVANYYVKLFNENREKIVLRKATDKYLIEKAAYTRARHDALVAEMRKLMPANAPNSEVYAKINWDSRPDNFYAQEPKKPTAESVGVKYIPTVRLMDRRNIKGDTEERIIIYMKSAGVAGEEQEAYQYFEMRPEHEADNFMESLNTQVDDEFNAASTNPIEYAGNLATEQGIKRKPGRPTKEEANVIDTEFRPVFLSENAITLSHKMQLIVRFFGSPGDIHENYDYAHCMCWYDFVNNHLELPSEALECILSKSLIYRGSLYPLASIFRLRKFIARGWRITAGQLLKIMFQISNIDLNNAYTLREQLIGVDQAYMHQLLRAIESAEKIDATYLAKLIDEIFEDN